MTTYAEYSKVNAVNWSTLKYMAKSPLHYRHARDNRSVVDGDHFRVGSLAHAAILEPDTIAESFARWDGGARRGKRWDAFRDLARGRGCTVIDDNEMGAALSMAAAVINHPGVADLLARSTTEWSLQWTDAETDIACKGRIDAVTNDGHLLDVKTTRDISAFARSAASYQYCEQMAWYRAGLIANCIDVKSVSMIAVESVAPYDVGVFLVDGFILDGATEITRRLLHRLADCQARDHWPGHWAGGPIEMPRWWASANGVDDGGAYTLEDE